MSKLDARKVILIQDGWNSAEGPDSSTDEEPLSHGRISIFMGGEVTTRRSPNHLVETLCATQGCPWSALLSASPPSRVFRGDCGMPILGAGQNTLVRRAARIFGCGICLHGAFESEFCACAAPLALTNHENTYTHVYSSMHKTVKNPSHIMRAHFTRDAARSMIV